MDIKFKLCSGCLMFTPSGWCEFHQEPRVGFDSCKDWMRKPTDDQY